MAENTARVLAIGVDPGGTTGICALYASGEPAIVQCDPYSAPALVSALLPIEQERVLLAVEKFIVGHRAGRSSTPAAGRVTRNLIGELHAVSAAPGHRPVIVEHPAVLVKRWATDTRLEAAGLLQVTKGMGHARDGCRHALYAAVEHGLLPDPLSKEWKNR